MQSKSSRAFRTISEASAELDLKPHVLRFWEAKFPDLSPVTRGGGRRFYRPEDVDFLRGLRILLHEEKHKIKDVQKLIKMKGAQSIVELGHSEADTVPSGPIETRDLVPARIKVSAAKPKRAKPHAPVPKPESSVSALKSSSQESLAPRESSVEPAHAPFTPARPSKSVLTAQSKSDLEAALQRLTSLRSRWQAYQGNG